jgi:transcriptional regulator with XRE-family HTH domain
MIGDMSVDKDKIDRREKLKVQLQDKRYRDAFVSEHINEGISFQIRALRKNNGWTQKQLAKQTGMAQERISVAENPNYSRFNITTLKRIASAFDVAFIGRFVPISELVNWEFNLSSETLAPVSFEEDPYFKEAPQQENITAYSQPEYFFVSHHGLETTIYTHAASGGLRLGGEELVNFLNPSQSCKSGITNLDDFRATREMTKGSQKETENQMNKLMAGGAQGQ